MTDPSPITPPPELVKMNQKTLQAAIIEAERFLDLAKELQMQSAPEAHFLTRGTADSSAVVRLASMDLTRALEALADD